MAYTKQTWADLPSKTTPINAERLTHIEDGIFNAAQTADTAASTAGTAAANIGIVTGRVETLTGRVNGLDTAVSNKVDKVAGKGLSTNDYDDTDKGKVDALGTASTKNSTSVVTDSSDLVESGAVKDAVDGIYSVMGKNGAKNRLFLTLAVLKANNTQGTWSNNVYTYNGLIFTVYFDASGYVNGIKITGTNTAQSGYTVFKLLHRPQNVTGMKLSGCPSGGSTHSYAINYTNSSTFAYWDLGNGTDTLTQFDYTQFPNSNIGILIEYGYACPEGGLMFYPMLRLASDTDPTYAEPSLTNVELTSGKADNSVIGTVENGTNPTKAYAVGEHFIRGGKFCTVTVPVTTSSTWTLGSNYVEGTIADNLVKQDTFSGSTDSTGNVQISTNNTIKILSALSENRICIPFKSSSGTYVKICQPHNMEPIPSTAISGTYYFY